MDIGAWLRGLELERYEQAFRDNEIDQRILPELTRIIHRVAIGRREAGRRGASFRGVGDAVVGV